ncbi:hypothetical protein C3729_02390 [Cloacibacterium normanense]|uniref:CAAX prenyl protease 2/Lysostaphin resistance protein A-like domain-containing protein n=1 Tax=Cloacibacterium normanense TaxID=237258 RepID=A0A2S7I8I1_9FLAO|nr:CPBP family glutamic-type intramembrane protease [Cloacibacterium normanense]PPZ92874.1 hypothetical protein C3729_02390 [Cloacibacterium normanense]
MKKKYIIDLLIFTFLGFITSEVSESLVNFLADEKIASKNPISKDNLTTQILLGIIISPVFETFVFQYLIPLNTRKVFDSFPLNFIAPIFFSSTAFALMHFFSIYYVIDGFIIGCFFSFVFLYIFDKYNSKVKAFFIVWFIHVFLNTIAILN